MARVSHILLLMVIKSAVCFSDVGIWDISMTGERCELSLAKSLFKHSYVNIMLLCETTETRNLSVMYEWIPTKCSPDYFHYYKKTSAECTDIAVREPDKAERGLTTIVNSTDTSVKHFVDSIYICENKKTILLENYDIALMHNKQINYPRKTKPLLLVEKDGIYILSMLVQGDELQNVSIHIEIISPYGYLSAAIWPLLPFFGVMCGVYTVLSAGWLIVCGLQWRDLLRIQYWIGGVALLGMIESATFYAVYASINRTGFFNTHAYIFAEWMSVAKRALARMLVIIVSLGFGIVKPRLGPALQRVLAVGLLWALLAAIDAWLRLNHKQNDTNRDMLLSQAPLSLLDSAICWWVFVSLSHTMRTLQLRRNTIKLALYQHFTNTLIFSVFASAIFMVYSIRNYRMMTCITDWGEVWMDEGYWHMLFAGVLTVIMVLWRPTNNNQRYAFTPLLDNAEDDDDEEEQFVNDAYGVKMRGAAGDVNINKSESTSNTHEPANSLDSDLRWVEENIPHNSLPLLDSDEEILRTKFEVSKMQ